MKFVQGIRATRGVDAGWRLGGSKRRQRNNFGPPWKDSHGKLRGGAIGRESYAVGARRKWCCRMVSWNAGTDTGYAELGE